MTRVLVLAIALVALSTACGGGGDSGPSTDAGPSKLTDVRTIADFREAFEADEGVPRLILVLGPT